MPKIPRTTRTISQIVETQLPDFVLEDYPKFVAFLKAYYEWLESNGTEIFSCKIVTSGPRFVRLTSNASNIINDYQGMYLVALNGPLKGNTKKISSYDPATKTVHIEDPWLVNQQPPPNTRMAIRQAIYPGQLLDYADIDRTLDRFIEFFRNEFMYQIPGTILADKRNVLKHIKEFYQARGTEDSFRFLFRILFNEEVEFYYPKVDLFRASDARWYVEYIMRVTTTGDTFDYVNRKLIGVSSGATAKVESATQQHIGGQTVTELKLSSIDGTFQIDPGTGLPEQVKIVYPVDPPPQTELGAMSDLLEPYDRTKWEAAYQLLEKLLVNTPGDNYRVGETITINGNGALAPAQAVITAIHVRYFNGRCSPPPTSYYLEPFFGPNDTVNVSGDPLKDGVCIPGLYFFSDVRSQFADSDLLNATEIMLAASETTEDDFFVGDEIAIVGGTGNNQKRTIVSYNGVTKIAVVDTAWDILPDGTTLYSITHVRGGIKAVKITDFGLGFVDEPTITINSVDGAGAVLPPILGLVGQTNGEWAAGRAGGVGEIATSPDGFPSSNKIIQDSYYWQDFSYDLRVGQTIDQYRDVVKLLLHPAGMKMFGTMLIKTKPKTDFLGTIRRYILELDSKAFDNKITFAEETELELSTKTPQVLGARNKDLDWEKFFAFPPNTTFTFQYPYPNQNYWLPGGPGNTTINDFKDVVIGSIINFPNRRTKVAPDAYLRIDNANSLTRVGPVGQTRGTVAKFRFTGFPPYEGFDLPYPEANTHYWDYYGNTQISTFKNVPISEMIVNPKLKKGNATVDSQMVIYRQGRVPQVGDLVEYAFLEGMDPQIVYDVGPNGYHYDGTLGSDINAEVSDPTWTPEGAVLSAADQEIVNATGIPQSLKACTAIVIAKTPTLANMTLLSSITDASSNGFSIDIMEHGGVSFRAQYGGEYKTVSFADGTVTADEYFMAMLRFDNGWLSGAVNHGRTVQAAHLPNYPSAPIINTDGWYFGKPSPDYTFVDHAATLFKTTVYGSNLYGQAASVGVTVSMGYFDGTLAYAIFFDRAVYDFELDFIFSRLREKLLRERGILLVGVVDKTITGCASIRKNTGRTLVGTSRIVKEYQKTITGTAHINHRTVKVQTGTARLQNTTTNTVAGVSAIQKTTDRTLTGDSRIERIVQETILGTAAVQNTTTQNFAGHTRIETDGVTQTFEGVSRIRVTMTQTLDGVSRIENIPVQHLTGNATIQNTTVRTLDGTTRIAYLGIEQTLDGDARIQKGSTYILGGDSRITATTTRTLTGGASIQNTTDRTLSGIAAVQATTEQTLSGDTRITASSEQNLTGDAALVYRNLTTLQGGTRLQNTASRTLVGDGRVRSITLPTTAQVASFAITPTNANYTMVDNSEYMRLAYTGSTPVGYPIGLYDVVNFGTSKNFTFTVEFKCSNLSSSNVVGIGIQDDSGGSGALTRWVIGVNGSQYHVDRDHYWNNSGWYNWNFFSSDVGATSLPPPNGLFKMRLRYANGDAYWAYCIDGSTWVEDSNPTSSVNVVSIFPLVQDTAVMDIYTWSLVMQPTMAGVSRIQKTVTKTLSGTSAVENTTTKTLSGTSAVRNTTTKTLDGTSTIS